MAPMETAMAPTLGTTKAEPSSWGELLQSYRDTYGSRSYNSSVEPQVRFTRSVPSVCPLAETTHPLFAVGSNGTHTVNAQDGSYQRSQWHGWGDVSLLKHDGYEGQPHPRGIEKTAGKKILPAPCKDGRTGLFGVLQCADDERGSDAWLGNLLIDPAKGKRPVAAPTDPKMVSMQALLAHTTPGAPSEDAWLGHISIDPAKGKGHAPDPSSLRGRSDLFAILQQQLLHEDPASSSSGGSGRSDAYTDAWMGNRLIQPNKGRKVVDTSPAAANSLHGATFKGGPPAEGCWCDLPPIGKRPLQPPSDAYHFVTAAQTMAIEMPLPPEAVLGVGKPQGKASIPDPYYISSKPEHIDMYALMTFKPLSDNEADRCQHTWNDAPHQTRKKAVTGAAAAGSTSLQQLLAAQPAQPVRFVPFGGLAQEQGMTLNSIVANRKSVEGRAGSRAGSANRSSGGGSGAGGSGSKAGGSTKGKSSSGAGGKSSSGAGGTRGQAAK